MPTTSRAPLALHVTLRWRDDVIAFQRLAGDAAASIDALAPIPRIVASGKDLVFARVARGAAFAVAPAGGAAAIRRADGAFEIVEGPAHVPLGAGDRVDLHVGDFRVEATADTPETLPRERRRASGAWAGIAVAALAHATAFGLAVQDARAGDAGAREDERTRELAGLFASAEQRARAVDPPVPDGQGAGEGRRESGKRGDGQKGGGTKAAGEPGAMGDRDARPGQHRRYAVPEDTKKDPAPSTSRAEALTDARTFGMIGLLGEGSAAPSAAFRDDWAHGADAIAARGDLWGQRPGESFGTYGLGLSGIGEGGGGRGEGIGLGSIGWLGHSDGPPGSGTGGDGSWGRGGGRGWGGGRVHHVRAPTVRRYRCSGDGCMISGRLPPEVIQRIVRLNFNRFRLCYEHGLARNPDLRGTVTVRFVIGHDGAVSNVGNGGSTLPDPDVVSCVVRAFYGISFSAPDGGIVVVTYPIAFAPT